MSAMPMSGSMMGMPGMPMMGNMMPMMGGMGMMPMPMMGGMQSMPMMPGMMMPMMMPMTNGMMTPIACKVSCELTRDGMTMKLAPVEPSMMSRMKDRCEAMSAMMTMGAPIMMTCGGMPMMVGMPMTK